MSDDLVSPPEPLAPPTPLVHAGEVIHECGEMPSLTSMWAAARRKHVEDGGDAAGIENRRPSDGSWKEGAEFIAALRRTMNVSRGHIHQGERGTGGSTHAHRQVALAYAKHLGLEFHMWCTTVVKAHMEGLNGPAPTIVPFVPSPVGAAMADFEALFSVAKLIGLDRGQCALGANEATARVRGVDPLGEPISAMPLTKLDRPFVVGLQEKVFAKRACGAGDVRRLPQDGRAQGDRSGGARWADRGRDVEARRPGAGPDPPCPRRDLAAAPRPDAVTIAADQAGQPLPASGSDSTFAGRIFERKTLVMAQHCSETADTSERSPSG